MSAKEDHPKKWLRQIKQIIEQNPIFQSVFPEIQKDPAKWDDMEILIKRPTSLTGQAQASITAASMLAGQASQHYDHIIVDDPVNERIAKSEPLMNEAKNTFDHVEALTKDYKTSSFDVIGTPWGRSDVLKHVMDTDVAIGQRLFWWLNARGEFKMSERLYKEHPECAVDLPKGKPIFPERVPESKLRRIENKRPEEYYLQYLCKPYTGGRNGYNMAMIRNFALHASGNIQCECHPEHDHSLANMTVVGLSDPAVTEDKRGCESSLLIVAKAACGCRFLLEEYGAHMLPPDLMRLYTETCTKWQPYLSCLGIESVAFQKVFKFWLLERQGQGKFPLGVVFADPKPENRSKDARASSQLNPVSDGLWHVRPEMQRVEGINNTMSQIATWPFGDARDRLDAFAYADEVFAEAPAPGGSEIPGEESLAEKMNDAQEKYDMLMRARSDD
jgi:hypothetical protein